MQPQSPNESCEEWGGGGQNKLCQNSSTLICFCSFEIAEFNKTILKDMLSKCLKFLSSGIIIHVRVTQISMIFFYIHVLFCQFNSAFNVISHYKLCAIFLPNRWDFLSDDLVTYCRQRSERITDNEIKCHRR